MEENKFEKRVQQKMDEFVIQPSDDVWQKIEARIENKKRSRLGLILLFLFFCLVLSGGYMLWNSGQHRIAENKNRVKKNTERTIDNKTEKENYNSQSKIDSGFSSTNQNKNSIINTGIKKSVNKKSIRHYKLTTKPAINTVINSPEKNSVIFSKNENVIINNPGKTENETIASKPKEVQKNELEPNK
ncbi:MAG: hypothetical protein ACRDE5_11580, partial [Ginsengibacter sp.]